MLMVIFGAGASYDSSPSFPPSPKKRDPHWDIRPPLADELFDNRGAFSEVAARFQRCVPIILRLRHRGQGASVEQELQRLQEESEGYPDGYRQLAAIRFYLSVILRDCVTRWNNVTKGITNYPALLDQILRSRKVAGPTCLVTFNYDTLLEEALRTVGKPIRSIEGYIAGDEWKVVKIHGSVDWSREVDSPLEPGPGTPLEVALALIETAPDLKISRRYRMLSGILGNTQLEPLFPALAIPVEAKQEYECPDEHLQTLNECLPKITKLLVIGWRASEDRFLDLLVNNLQKGVRMMAVAGGGAEAIGVLEKLRGAGLAGIAGEFSSFDEGGFSAFVLSPEVEKFLRR